MRHVLIMFDTRVTQAAQANAGGPSPLPGPHSSGQTLIVSFYHFIRPINIGRFIDPDSHHLCSVSCEPRVEM